MNKEYLIKLILENNPRSVSSRDFTVLNWSRSKSWEFLQSMKKYGAVAKSTTSKLDFFVIKDLEVFKRELEARLK